MKQISQVSLYVVSYEYYKALVRYALLDCPHVFGQALIADIMGNVRL